MLECILKDVRDFICTQEERLADVTRYYCGEGLAWRFLIPDGQNDQYNLTFTEVVFVPVFELSSSTPAEALERIAEQVIPRPRYWKERAIDQKIYVFMIARMIGKFKSFWKGKRLFMFFNITKLLESGVKFRVLHVLGRLYKKRAEKIVEATLEKTGEEPFGFLASLVEFFRRIGSKMLSAAARCSVAVRLKNSGKKVATTGAIIYNNTASSTCTFSVKLYVYNSTSNSNFSSVEDERGRWGEERKTHCPGNRNPAYVWKRLKMLLAAVPVSGKGISSSERKVVRVQAERQGARTADGHREGAPVLQGEHGVREVARQRILRARSVAVPPG